MSEEILYEGKFLKLIAKEGWEYVRRDNCEGAVAVIAMTDEGEVILIEQYRVPAGGWVIEFPAGLVNDLGQAEDELESFKEAAMRELIEETGYEASEMVYLNEGPLSAGLCANKIELFRAYGLRKVSDGGGDETEKINVHTVKLEEVADWIKSRQKEGVMVDPKVYAGLYFLMTTGKSKG
ncbi:MAG: NUDIX hydrolase [Candidatus Omnitrophica bacterium]|nr:NUDIX hydrolase [Candidatus Omnitrophota bacterium]